MPKLMTVMTFDLKAGESADYKIVKAVFAPIHLRETVTSKKGKKVRLPFNTLGGKVRGRDHKEVREKVRQGFRAALKLLGKKGRIFVHVSGEAFAWGGLSSKGYARLPK